MKKPFDGHAQMSACTHRQMSLGCPLALRQSQRAHSSRLRRVRFQSGFDASRPRIRFSSPSAICRPCMIIALAMPEQYNKREIESSPKKKLFSGCVSETDSLLFLALKGAGAPSQRFVQGGRNTEHLFTPRERLQVKELKSEY